MCQRGTERVGRRSARLFGGGLRFFLGAARFGLFELRWSEHEVEQFGAVFPDAGFVGVHDDGDGIQAVSRSGADEDLLGWDGVTGFDAVAVGVFFEQTVVVGEGP